MYINRNFISRKLNNNHGWWQYDERTSQELETSYKRGEKTCELLIAGFLYVIDLENMLQLRRNDPSRRRKIKRDFSSIEKKGVAGLRTSDDVESIQYLEGDQDSIRPINPTEGRIDATATPTNTPQSTSTSGRQSPEQNRHDDIQAVVDSIYSLRLESTENSDDSTNERPQKHIVLNNIRNGHREREM